MYPLSAFEITVGVCISQNNNIFSLTAIPRISFPYFDNKEVDAVPRKCCFPCPT